MVEQPGSNTTRRPASIETSDRENARAERMADQGPTEIVRTDRAEFKTVTREAVLIPWHVLAWLFSYKGRIGLSGLYLRSLVGWFCWPVMLPLGAVFTPGSWLGPAIASLSFFMLVMTSAVVRRLHDLGHSGRKIRPPPSPQLWLDTHTRAGELGRNRWGPPPGRWT